MLFGGQMLKSLKMILISSFFLGCFFVDCTEIRTENVSEKHLLVITGVTKGVGRALASEFANRGWAIAGCGRSAKQIQELQNEYGPKHLFSVVDITDDASVARWAKEVSLKMGSPSILINNAALINEPNVLWKVPASEFSEVMNINVIGTVNILRHFTPLMIQRGKGLIVNVSSGWGVSGEEKFSPYCASKFAIEGLTQSLARELPQGLTVVALAPGVINTDMLKKALPEWANQYPTAEQRAKILVPIILNIKPSDSGKHLSTPEHT